MKKLRRITEAEVIAEFLQGEFFHREYDADRKQFTAIVNHPDLTNETENKLRRALLFRRRATMWWELPDDRQWWEIELEPGDVQHVSVFPRARWFRLARLDFKANYVVQRVRRHMEKHSNDEFTRKMVEICSGSEEGIPGKLIIFLGIDEHHRVTLLEGNHRFIASLLAPDRNLLTKMQLVAAFSPSMERCCWYKTNFQTLFRCLKNRIQHYWDRDPDVAGMLRQTPRFRSTSPSVKGPGPVKSRI